MKKTHKRLAYVISVVCCLTLAAGLALHALKDNVSYFRSPTDVKLLQQEKSAVVTPGHVFRLGGLVKEDSLIQRSDDLFVQFVITDHDAGITVTYSGILPDLFREGQGVIAKGALDNDNIFRATEILAKHDENYMPPEVKKALEPKNDY